ncbi:MAG TPA: GNAT family N-acetyltransferase [Thermohalobaculum sp.]|nr:GNAT family N-acetyltransferase [Thermohalobaculum sp.]
MIVRRLLPWEGAALRAHLLRLGPDERLMRFCIPASDRLIHAYCDRVDPLRTIALGCFVDGTLRGVAELIQLSGDWPMSAELALSVERPFQDRGIGGDLMDKTLTIARNRLIRTVCTVFLPENEKMRHLLRRSGATLAAYPASGEAEIALAWSSPGSLLEEMAMNGAAVIAAVLEP